MKTQSFLMVFGLGFAAWAAGQTPPVYQAAPPAQAAPQPAATPAPPPAAAAKRSAADLEKLVAPIALYPDPLIATLLPASVYPLEIVQAARFVANTNNLAKLDEQPWDENVKAVARVPAVIQKLNDDISWTIELGEAFLAQDKDVMDAIQVMRGKAQKAGTLQTTPQQVVVVTNMVIEKTVEQKVIVVTNTVVQIQPASSTVVYVPTYNPYTVYYPPPAYVYNPMAPLVTFGVAVGIGAIMANNCDWHHGGCYNNNVNINVNNNYNYNQNNNINRNNNNINNKSGNNAQQKWQPDQSRLSKSGSPTAANSARTAEARGYGSGGAKPSTGSVGARPSTGTSPGAGTARPSAGASPATRPSTGTQPSAGNAAARPSTGTPSASRPAAAPSTTRSSSSPNYSQPKASPAASRPSSSGSAFGGASSGPGASASSSRGNSSRSSGGGGARGGGGGRSGGGGRR